MESIETYEQDGWTVELHYDSDAMSPGDWDTLATFEQSAGYRLGEPISEPERGWNVYIRALSIFGDDVAGVLPVRIAEHGAQATVWESDADSANGVLYTTHARVNELCGEDPQYHERAWVEDALRGELVEWRQYIEGDVYGYIVTAPNGEQVDSLWGLYGFEYAEKTAREALSDEIEYERKTIAAVERICAL